MTSRLAVQPRPDAELPQRGESDRRLPLYVIATTLAGTRAALMAAGRYAHSLSPFVTLVVPHVVGYPDVLADSEAAHAHATSLAADACQTGPTPRVLGVVCRSASQVIDALPADAVVLVGGRRGRLGWRTAPERLVTALCGSGRSGLFVPVAR